MKLHTESLPSHPNASRCATMATYRAAFSNPSSGSSTRACRWKCTMTDFSLFGRLSMDAVPHDPVALGGVVFMLAAGGATFAFLTYFKLWKWLWVEYLT